MSKDMSLNSTPSITQIGTTSKKFADNFAGGAAAAGQPSIDALDARGWNIVRNSGVTVTLNNGSLVIGLGTASGNEFLMVGPSQQTIPANITASLLLSQRIAGQEIRFGYVAVNPATGLPVAHDTLSGSFANYTAVMFNSTTATSAILEALGENLAAARTATATNSATTATLADYSLEVRNEDVTLVSSAADVNTVRAAGSARLSSAVPNVNLVYAPFVWVRNTAAAGSNTNVTINRIVALDIQELQAEVGGGRGNQTPSQSIPVAVTSVVPTITTLIAGASSSASANALTAHKLISAATTNLTSVKAAQGRISGGLITNASASWRYIKFFNKNAAPVIPTDIPILTVGIPPNGQAALGSMFDQYGLHFAAGIAYAITAGPTDADNVAVGANEVVVALLIA